MPWNGIDKLKIVTHHWGANWNKGFDVYQKIDRLLADEYWSEKIEFTYIGNLPSKFKFEHSFKIDPLSGKELASEIKKNHLYITASLNEPSGNHHIEAAQCSLPILYVDSGGIPEYCEEFGIKFNLENLEEMILYALQNYEKYQKNMINYPFSSTKMCFEYLNLFENLLIKRDEVISNRNIFELESSNELIYKFKRFIKKYLY